MDKRMKVEEDEQREKERRSTKFYALNEVRTLKCNPQMIKVEKMNTQDLYL